MPILRPSTDEYDLYYAHYVDGVATDDVLDLLEAQGRNTVATFSEVADERASVRPGPGEWSIKEVVGHLCDFERVFGYRAMHFARGSGLALQTFEQDAFVAASEANARQLTDLLAEFSVVRAATVALLGGMNAEMLARRGVASGAEMSARAIPFVIAGHEAGHLADQVRVHGL